MQITSRHAFALLELKQSNKREAESTGGENLANTFQNGGGHGTDPGGSTSEAG